MELELLKKLEEILGQQQSILDDMRESGDKAASDFGYRVVGYKCAVDDLRVHIHAELDEMAVAYGQ